jgi:hypothetical protein
MARRGPGIPLHGDGRRSDVRAIVNWLAVPRAAACCAAGCAPMAVGRDAASGAIPPGSGPRMLPESPRHHTERDPDRIAEPTVQPFVARRPRVTQQLPHRRVVQPTVNQTMNVAKGLLSDHHSASGTHCAKGGFGYFAKSRTSRVALLSSHVLGTGRMLMPYIRYQSRCFSNSCGFSSSVTPPQNRSATRIASGIDALDGGVVVAHLGAGRRGAVTVENHPADRVQGAQHPAATAREQSSSTRRPPRRAGGACSA